MVNGREKMLNQFSRTELLLGKEALEKLKRKMLLLGYRDYPDACSEITKIFEKGMEAGERSETICDNW